MTALQSQIKTLGAAGVNVVAITAEPGGEKEVRQRLTERGVPSLDFEVRSDPKHEFLHDKSLQVPTDIFVMKDHDWDVSGPYKMIQPALVVYNAQGQVVTETTWSWKTMGLEDGAWNTRVDTQEWAGPIKQVLLVTMRRVMSDLLPAIREGRPIKLASTHDNW